MQQPNSPTPQPVFEAAAFSIPFLSDDPAGYELATRDTLGRTEPLDGRLEMKPSEAQQFAQGISGEARFSGANALRATRTAYLEARAENSEDASNLRQKFDVERLEYRQRGKKIGLTAVTLSEDNLLEADISIVAFPTYRDFAIPEAGENLQKLGRAAGVAMIVRTADNRLIIQHRAVETIRLNGQGKSPGNAAYSDMPGASVAGMVDASLRAHGRQPGTPDAISTETIRNQAMKEAGEELGLAPEAFVNVRLAGMAQDHVKPHDELLMLADTSLNADDVYDASRTSNRNKNLNEVDLAEKFFDIEASPQAIYTLLAEVKCPLPPTHAAALVAAGYQMVIESSDVATALTWRRNLQHAVNDNYAHMDSLVQSYYDTFPSATLQVPERYWGKSVPPRDLRSYNPRYTPEEQGLPSLEDEMVRTGLLPETRTPVDTAWLLDVDGVITDPQEKRVTDERIVDQLLSRLQNGEPIGLNTGRSSTWVLNNVVPKLLSKADADTSVLSNLIIIGEKGATWTTFAHDGEPQHGRVESLTISPGLRREIDALTEKYSGSMANLDPKTTMASIEMLDGMDLDDFHAVQSVFVEELKKLVEEHDEGAGLRVDATTIATDIENPHVGKALGTQRFLEFLKQRNIKPSTYEAFGDSPSDLAMAEELARLGKDVSMNYVGDPRKIAGETYRFPVKSKLGYSAATAELLSDNR